MIAMPFSWEQAVLALVGRACPAGRLFRVTTRGVACLSRLRHPQAPVPVKVRGRFVVFRMGDDVGVDVATLQRRIRVRFRSPELLAQAMVHRSYLNEAGDAAVESNERLEFLGDAVLGCIVAHLLFERYPAVDEGRLTELRAHIVKGETLAIVAERLDLGAFLLLGRGEDATGGRRRPLNLARTLESLIGAMYLDRGFERTERFVLRVLALELQSLGGGDLRSDAKSRLQHRAQHLFGAPPRYRIVAAEGPDHAKTFTVEAVAGERSLGAGQGRSKRLAEKLAAEQALALLDREFGPDAS